MIHGFLIMALVGAATPQRGMKATAEAIDKVHAAYCAVTGLAVPLTMSRLYTWETWLTQGWTSQDLQLVVKMLKWKLKEPARLGALRFSSLIGDTERFGEDLAEARARARTHRIAPGKAQVLRATGRTAEHPQAEPKSAEAILRASQALAELLRARDNL